MTRLFTDGAEFGDTLFWDAGTSGPVASTTQKRSGAYSYYFAGNGTVGNKILSPALSEVYVRFGWWPGWISNANNDFLVFYNGANTPVSIAYSTTTWFMSLKINGGVVLTGTTPVSLNVWHLIEVYVLIGDSGHVTVKLDGLIELDYAGDTKPGSYTNVDKIQWIWQSAGNYYDDIAANNTSGLIDNSWCGDGHIELLTPNGNGDVNDWTGSDGDKVNNYLLVDEIPSNSDTDYVKASTDLQDMYNVSDFTATGKIVTRIWSEARAKDNDATAGAVWLGYKTSGNVYLSSSARVLSGLYTRIIGDEATVNPADSGVWEDADLDAIQFVIECSSTSSSTSSSSSSSIP